MSLELATVVVQLDLAADFPINTRECTSEIQPINHPELHHDLRV